MAERPTWEDDILVAVAATLVEAGESDVADALLVASEVTVSFGDSWWDGHDDYIYDVLVTVATDPRRAAVVSNSPGVRRAFGSKVDFFRDGSDRYRRGTLHGFELAEAPVVIDRPRLVRRRADLARSHAAPA